MTLTDGPTRAAASAGAGGMAGGAGGHAVPRILHQIWLGDAPVPDECARCRAVVLRMHPPSAGWRCVLWRDPDAERLVQGDYPWLWPTWRAYPHLVQRVDALRLVLLHRHGGFYLDMDALCLQPLDALLAAHPRASLLAAAYAGGSLLAALTGMDLLASNHLLAGAPGHPALDGMVRDLPAALARYRGPPSRVLRVFRTTGPDFVSRHLRRAGAVSADSGAPGSVVLLPTRVSSAPAAGAGPDACVVHEGELTWLPVVGPLARAFRRLRRTGPPCAATAATVLAAATLATAFLATRKPRVPCTRTTLGTRRDVL